MYFSFEVNFQVNEIIHKFSLLYYVSGTNGERDVGVPASNGSVLNKRHHSSLMQRNDSESVSGMDIGGGWQLAYKMSEGKGEDGNRGGGLQRIYLHQDNMPGSRPGSVLALVGGDVPTDSEFVSRSAIHSKGQTVPFPVESELVRPSETTAKGTGLADLFEPGVKHALVVGVGLQILQQVIT